MANISRIASPMNICEEDLYDITKKVETEKSFLKQLQTSKPATFMVGTIDNVNQRISNLDDELSQYDGKLVIESRSSDKSYDNIKRTPSRRTTTSKAKEEKDANEFAELYAIRSTTTPEVKPKRKMGTITQVQKKSDAPRLVELQQFPGWKSHKYTVLPHNLATNTVLDHVLLSQKHLKRKPYYRKEFHRLVYSKIHCGMLQDAFWWFFLNKYHPHPENQRKLFGRIAYNYVRLFIFSENPKFRDVFFMNYGSLLAQCIYSTFCLAFPQSWRQFDAPEFKESLCQISCEWVCGIRPPPRTYELWHVAELEPKGMRKEEVMKQKKKSDKDKLSVGRISPSSSAASTKGSIGYSRAGSNKTLSTRKHESVKALQASARSLQQGSENTISERNILSPITEVPLTIDDTSTTRTKTKVQPKSFAAGKPVHLSRNVFNINGRSPLLAEFFRQYGLDKAAGADILMRHTQIEKLPEKDEITFQDIIDESKKNVKAASDDFKKWYETYCKEKLEYDSTQKEELDQFWLKTNKLLSKPQKVHYLSNLILMEMKRDKDEVTLVGATAACINALAAEKVVSS